MSVELSGRGEWDWPTDRALRALRRIHRGEPVRPRWVRFLERLFGAAAP